MNLNDICGNEHAKRALEVAAVDNHSIQFIGSHRSQLNDLHIVANGWGKVGPSRSITRGLAVGKSRNFRRAAPWSASGRSRLWRFRRR